jgi:fructokinase
LLDASGISTNLFEGCRWLHIMGSSLYNRGAISAARTAMDEARRRGCRVSFDPNIRPDLTGSPEVPRALWEALENCDLFLPSDSDLRFFHLELSSQDAIRKFLERPSLEAVVLKRGLLR